MNSKYIGKFFGTNKNIILKPLYYKKIKIIRIEYEKAENRLNISNMCFFSSFSLYLLAKSINKGVSIYSLCVVIISFLRSIYGNIRYNKIYNTLIKKIEDTK